MYILSQVIGLVALVITLVSYHLDTKKKIFKSMCIANVCDMIHYLFLGAYSGFLTKVIAFIRNIFIVEKEEHRNLNNVCFLFVFIFLYLVFGILSYDGIISLFPCFAAIIYIIVVWNGDEGKVKFIAFLCYFLWLIYNVFVEIIPTTEKTNTL